MSAGLHKIDKRSGRSSSMSVMITIALLTGINMSSRAQVIQDSIPELQKIGVLEHLGERIPLELTFTDDSGNTVRIGDYFNRNRPVIIDLAYYTCPMLCNLVMNGIAQGVAQLNLAPAKDYQIVSVSFDPRDSPSLAAEKRANYIRSIGKPIDENGWRFLADTYGNASTLAKALGFQYFYDKEKEQYAHSAVIFILTPDGHISRYLYGIEFKKNDLRLALLEAAQGEIGSTIDRIILYCYHYDPEAKGYVLFATRLMRIGGIAIVIMLAFVMTIFWIREHRRG